MLKAEGTGGGGEVEGWHGSELCAPEDLRSVHTCSTHQECSKVLIPAGLFFFQQSAGALGSVWAFLVLTPCLDYICQRSGICIFFHFCVGLQKKKPKTFRSVQKCLKPLLLCADMRLRWREDSGAETPLSSRVWQWVSMEEGLLEEKGSQGSTQAH